MKADKPVLTNLNCQHGGHERWGGKGECPCSPNCTCRRTTCAYAPVVVGEETARKILGPPAQIIPAVERREPPQPPPREKTIAAMLPLNEQEMDIMISCIRAVTAVEDASGVKGSNYFERRALLNRLTNIKRGRSPVPKG